MKTIKGYLILTICLSLGSAGFAQPGSLMGRKNGSFTGTESGKLSDQASLTRTKKPSLAPTKTTPRKRPSLSPVEERKRPSLDRKRPSLDNRRPAPSYRTPPTSSITGTRTGTLIIQAKKKKLTRTTRRLSRSAIIKVDSMISMNSDSRYHTAFPMKIPGRKVLKLVPAGLLKVVMSQTRASDTKVKTVRLKAGETKIVYLD